MKVMKFLCANSVHMRSSCLALGAAAATGQVEVDVVSNFGGVVKVMEVFCLQTLCKRGVHVQHSEEGNFWA